MIIKSKHLVLLGLILPTLSYAQISLDFISRKSTIQTGPRDTIYTGGTFSFRVSDGSYLIAGCAHNGTPFSAADPLPLGPDITCPLGTTAFITSGDIDNDGVSDVGEWWSLAQAPTAAQAIAPGRTDRVSVVQSPPSLFPRPGVFPVVDSGFTTWYNVYDDVSQRLYETSGYLYEQSFPATPAGRSEHDRTIVTGSYRFNYPALSDPNFGSVILGLDKLIMPEAWPGLVQSPLDWGFRFTNDDAWNEGANRMEFDPRFQTTLTWNGIDPNNAILASDQLRFWINRGPLAEPTLFPLTPADGAPFPFPVVFPPNAVPFVLPQADLYKGYYDIPPNLLNNTIGEELVAYLRLDRNFSNAFSTPGVFGIADASARIFGVNIMFVDTFRGFTVFSFPANTPDSERAPNGDYDGDGFSNLLEFAMSSNHLDALSVPGVTPVSLGPAPPGTFSVTPLADGRCRVALIKRPNIGGSLKYFFEHSEDLNTWTRIPDGGNADWVENVNDDTTLQVTSTASIVPGVAPSCYFRVFVQLVR